MRVDQAGLERSPLYLIFQYPERWPLYTSQDCNQNNLQPSSHPSPEAIQRHRRRNPKVILNVGGLRHEAMWSLLERRPLTRLGMLAKARSHQTIIRLVDSYSLDENEVYFDRDPLTFSIILNYYRTDKLHCVDELCVLDFAADLDFWQVEIW